MTSIFNLKSILNSTAAIALVAGFTLAPINFDLQGGSLVLTDISALANAHGGAGMGGGMGTPSNMGSQDMQNEMEEEMQTHETNQQEMGSGGMSEENMPAGMGENANGDHAAGRPMNLQDFMESLRSGVTIDHAERADGDIEIKYTDGWSEEILDGKYILTAPNGHVVISRDVVQRDIDRLNSAF